ALHRTVDEEGELGARPGPPWIFRFHRPWVAGEVPRAPDCGPARGAAHPEMAERGRAGGWEANASGRRNSAGTWRLAIAREVVPPLRFRPVGRGGAAEASQRRHDCRALCRRCGARIPAAVGCRAVLEGTQRATE